VIAQGGLNGPDQIRKRGRVRPLYISGGQDSLRDLPRRQRLRGRPEHVHGAAVDRAPLEPRVALDFQPGSSGFYSAAFEVGRPSLGRGGFTLIDVRGWTAS
jgi:hypothetical protein